MPEWLFTTHGFSCLFSSYCFTLWWCLDSGDTFVFSRLAVSCMQSLSWFCFFHPRGQECLVCWCGCLQWRALTNQWLDLRLLQRDCPPGSSSSSRLQLKKRIPDGVGLKAERSSNLSPSSVTQQTSWLYHSVLLLLLVSCLTECCVRCLPLLALLLINFSQIYLL